MKKTVSVFLAIALLLSAAAAYADGASDLKWGMTKEEVRALMGGREDGTLNDRVPAGYESLLYVGQKISKFDDAILGCFFVNDSLIVKMYSVSDSSRAQNYEYLLNAMEKKYGASSSDYSVSLRFLKLVGLDATEAELRVLVNRNVTTFATWKTEENDDICLIILNSGDNPRSYLLYFAPEEAVPDIEYDDSGL